MHRTILSLFCTSTITLVLCLDASGQSACTGSQVLTESKCAGDDSSSEEKALFDLVNRYRISFGKPPLKLSTPLSRLANRRILDLQQNMKTLTHSWSDCRYDINDEKSWNCVLDAPERLKTGYKGRGFETLYRTTRGAAVPADALDAWKKSSLHNSIILNLEAFKDMTWDEIGLAIEGPYAVLWIGSPGLGKPRIPDGKLGLGVSYEETVAGLSKLLSVKLESTTVDSNRWLGTSLEGNLTLEISGASKEINEANIAVTLRLSPGSKLDPASKAITVTLLRNIFPEWRDVEPWIDQSVASVMSDPSSMRAKLVRKIAIEMRAGDGKSITVLIRPQGIKPTYQEF